MHLNTKEGEEEEYEGGESDYVLRLTSTGEKEGNIKDNMKMKRTR